MKIKTPTHNIDAGRINKEDFDLNLASKILKTKFDIGFIKMPNELKIRREVNSMNMTRRGVDQGVSGASMDAPGVGL